MNQSTPEQTKELLHRVLELPVHNINRLNKVKRRFANDRNIGMVKNQDLLQEYRLLLDNGTIERNVAVENLLKRRSIRTLSGVAPITVMTAPLGCPKNCLYCPTEKNMPKSYLSNQPAAMRAVLSDFDPVIQTETRLRALKKNGHTTDKIEIIILGGTWSAHPASYQTWYITKIFETCNKYNEDLTKSYTYKNFDKAREIIKEKLQTKNKVDRRLYQPDDSDLRPALFAAQKVNETAKNRIIGITVETRPDHITAEEVGRLRMLGVTKAEIGVQTIYPEISKLNRRDQEIEDVIRATKLLKDGGFKVAYHIMPGMYGSTQDKDVEMFRELFSNPDFKPDFLKIYPCVVVKDSDLYELYTKDVFKPLTTEQLVDTVIKIKRHIPRYTRIARLQRDIPSESVAGGSKMTNVRELISSRLKEINEYCQCIRCREPMKAKADPTLAQFNVEEFDAAGAKEYFLTFDSPDEKLIFAFLRLRLPAENNQEIVEEIPELEGAAQVRELHTYGVLTPIDDKGEAKSVQHLGFGRRLMEKSEEIAKEDGVKKMAVIAGIGVREYYRKLGYTLEGTYMVKYL